MATRTRKKVWERLSLSASNYNILKYKCLSILKADRRSERWQNIDINTPILVNYLYRSIPRKSGYCLTRRKTLHQRYSLSSTATIVALAPLPLLQLFQGC